MSTYTQIIYQIVFSTKERKPILKEDNRPQLFRFIHGLLQNKKCHLYRINAVEDHMHLLVALPPSISLSSLIKDIKLASSDFIKKNHLFSGFTHWQEGYGAFTYSVKEKDKLIDYVKNQVEHHKTITFKDELISILNEHQVPFEEKYLF